MPSKLVVEHFDRQIFATALSVGDAFEEPFAATEFPCLLWTHAPAIPTEWRIQFTRELVASACRYVVCGGADCALMHDSIDATIVEAAMMHELGEERPLVMTTWHANESMDDVADFFVRHTNFGTHHFTQSLVVHLGGTHAEHQQLERAVARRSARTGAV